MKKNTMLGTFSKTAHFVPSFREKTMACLYANFINCRQLNVS